MKVMTRGDMMALASVLREIDSVKTDSLIVERINDPNVRMPNAAEVISDYGKVRTIQDALAVVCSYQNRMISAGVSPTKLREFSIDEALGHRYYNEVSTDAEAPLVGMVNELLKQYKDGPWHIDCYDFDITVKFPTKKQADEFIEMYQHPGTLFRVIDGVGYEVNSF